MEYNMEYKFLTIYQGEVVPCILDTFDNYVKIKTRILKFAKIIGRLKHVEGSPWPVLKIYQHIGRNDASGFAIYDGHILKFDNLILTVKYSVQNCAFELKYFIENMEFVFIDLKMVEQMQIIDHVALPKNCGVIV